MSAPDRAAETALDRPVAAWAFAMTCLIAMLIFNQTATHWRTNIADSHLFAFFGWSILHGGVPYLDMWDNKPPGLWWLNALAMSIGDRGLVADMIVGSVGLAIGVVSLCSLCARAYHASSLWIAGPVICVLLSHITFECGSNRTETWLIACECVAIALYARWLRERKTILLVVAALAAGCAPWFKQNGIGIGIVLALHAVVTSLRGRTHRATLITVLAGICTPSVLASAVLASQGALADAVFAIGPFNRLYFATGDASLLQFWPSVVHAAALLAPVAAVWPIAAVGSAAAIVQIARRSAGNPSDAHVPLCVIWFVVSAYLCCIGVGRMHYHIAPLLAPLALLGVHAIMLPIGERPLFASFQARAWRVAITAVCLAHVAQAASSSLIEARRCWREKTAWHSLTRRVPLDYEKQAIEIARLVPRDGRIYVWGWSPGTYRFAQRRAVSRFGTLEKVGQLRERGLFILDGAKADIMARRPAIFAISAGGWAELQEENNEFSRWMQHNYVQISEVDGMILLAPLTPGDKP